MADTRTISEEETTLDQLTEKNSLVDSDLLLTRDNANNDYKVKVSTVKSALIGGDVTAGNNKAVTGSTVNSALVAQGVSNIFTIGENFNLSDIKIYANTTLLNIQRFIVTPKNAITSSTNYVVGTLSSYRPKQVLRFTAYVNHKGVEGYIETNGNVIVYLESGSSGNIIFDNIVYFY